MLLMTTVRSETVKLVGIGAGAFNKDIVLAGKAVPFSIKLYFPST